MFQAMANLRAQGYNVPKIAPEYDPRPFAVPVVGRASHLEAASI